VEEVKNFVSKFTPYLEDIRRRLYATAIVFGVASILGFLSTSYLLTYLLSFFNIKDVVISTTSPFQFTNLSFDFAIFWGLVVASPVFVYNLFMFLRHALTKRERGLFFLLIPLAIILFIFGFLYGFAIMYYALILLAEINVAIGIKNIWDIGMFLSQIILTSALLGVLFQFPIIFTFIIRSGLLGVDVLRRNRRVAAVVIFIFVSILPPTDGLSLLVMALPLIILYEVTILVNSGVKNTSTSNLPS
jgi:sec-independent protein translocase protein TatC